MVFEVDTSGLFCPMPIIKLMESIKKVNIGNEIILRSTDPVSKEDVPIWCSSTGNELVSAREEDGVYIFIVRRKK